MDAGIIAAFKRRYRRLYWERTPIIDAERESLLPGEQGVSATSDYDDIFKASQLEAMEFVKAFWKEITETTITNCFQHTRIFNTPFVQELNPDDEGASSEEDGGQDQLCTENNLAQEISAIDEDVGESYLNLPTPGIPQYRSPANLTTENAVDNELSILMKELRVIVLIAVEMMVDSEDERMMVHQLLTTDELLETVEGKDDPEGEDNVEDTDTVRAIAAARKAQCYQSCSWDGGQTAPKGFATYKCLREMFMDVQAKGLDQKTIIYFILQTR